MKLLSTLLIALVAFTAFPTHVFAAQVATVTIDSTKVGDDLTDFPVYVDMSDLPSSFWDVTNCTDIRVFKDDGTTELPREIVSCTDNGSTGTGELHLKYTGTLSSTTDTAIEIHADGTSSDYAVTDTYGRNAVWSDYKFVYHLQSDGTDSTGAYDLTVKNDVDFVTAQIEQGSDSKSDNNLTSKSTARGLYNDSNSPLNVDSADYTIQVWTNFHNFDGSWWFFNARTSSADIIRISDDSYANGGTTVSFTTNPTVDTWERFEFIRSGTALSTFLNNSANGTGTFTSGSNSRAGLSLHAHKDNPDIFGGGNAANVRLDDVRGRQEVLSADWRTTEYNNQNSPSTFYTVTAVEEEAAAEEDIIWYFF